MDEPFVSRRTRMVGFFGVALVVVGAIVVLGVVTN